MDLDDQKTFAKDSKHRVIGVPHLGAPGDKGLSNLIAVPWVANKIEVGSAQCRIENGFGRRMIAQMAGEGGS